MECNCKEYKSQRISRNELFLCSQRKSISQMCKIFGDHGKLYIYSLKCWMRLILLNLQTEQQENWISWQLFWCPPTLRWAEGGQWGYNELAAWVCSFYSVRLVWWVTRRLMYKPICLSRPDHCREPVSCLDPAISLQCLGLTSQENSL